jgi:hypothetical protein
MEHTPYNRLFYRLKAQALIKDLREKFGDEAAFDIVAHAVRLECQLREQDDGARTEIR